MASTSGESSCSPRNELLETVEITFHDVPYILSLYLVGAALQVDVEQKSDASRWRAQFTAQQIEDITSKTGNFKKLPVFIKMLRAALRQDSDTVFADLLTYSDLVALKAQRGGAADAPFASTIPPNNKRYLILTYAAEFDRVHYPLPLAFDEAPDPEHLRRIISRLREELDQAKKGLGPSKRGDAPAEVRRLREENAALRQELKMGQEGTGLEEELQRLTAEVKEAHQLLNQAHKEREAALNRCAAIEEELQQERALHRRTLRRHAKELTDAQDDAARAKEVAKELRSRCNELLRASADSRRTSGRPLFPGSIWPAPKTYPPLNRTASQRLNGGRAGIPPSRTFSRETSPAQSRGASPATSRRPPSCEGHSQDRRPRSAPPRPRFNPTEFVRQKRLRETEALARLGRQPTPPCSASSFSSPGRPSVGPMPGAGSPSLSRASSRASSVERTRAEAVHTRTGAGRRSPALNHRPNSPGWGPNRRPMDPSPPAQRPLYPSRNQRASSPGRALQDVQERLNQYMQPRSRPPPPSVGPIPSMTVHHARTPPPIPTQPSAGASYQFLPTALPTSAHADGPAAPRQANAAAVHYGWPQSFNAAGAQQPLGNPASSGVGTEGIQYLQAAAPSGNPAPSWLLGGPQSRMGDPTASGSDPGPGTLPRGYTLPPPDLTSVPLASSRGNTPGDPTQAATAGQGPGDHILADPGSGIGVESSSNSLHGARAATGVSVPGPGQFPAPGGHFSDASAQIADIDSRLHALQDFLRAAKAGAKVEAR